MTDPLEQLCFSAGSFCASREVAGAPRRSARAPRPATGLFGGPDGGFSRGRWRVASFSGGFPISLVRPAARDPAPARQARVTNVVGPGGSDHAARPSGTDTGVPGTPTRL